MNEDDYETSLISACDCGIGFLKASPYIVSKYLEFKHLDFHSEAKESLHNVRTCREVSATILPPELNTVN